MADLPILFSGSMVRAILREIEQPGAGKTQTRRVLTSDMPFSLFNGQWSDSYVLDPGNQSWRDQEVRYAVGDRLYVREAWRVSRTADAKSPRDITPRIMTTLYEAGGSMGGTAPYPRDGSPRPLDQYEHFSDPALGNMPQWAGRLRQGMHMPRWASRLTLIVTDVSVQRLQEISEADAIAEGFHAGGLYEADPVANFIDLWNSLNASRGYGWDANPWVAAYTFRPILGNIDQVRP